MQSKRISRRAFLQWTGATGGLALLAACAPVAAPQTGGEQAAAASEAPAPEQVVMEWWWGWTPDLIVDTLNEVAATFTEAHPEIQIETGQHEWGEKLLTAYAAGTPPDIHEHWLPMQFAARDLLLTVDEWVDASAVIDWDLFPEVSWGVGRWQGAHYIIPALGFFAETALVVNPAVLEQAGLNVSDDIPQEWDDIFEQAREFTTFDDAGNLTSIWMAPSKDLRYWPAMYGIEDYDEEENRWRFDDPAWEEVVANIVRFYTEFGPEKIEGFFNSYPGWVAVPGSAFASDRQAMIISGYWIPGELDKNAPDKEFYYTWAPTGGAAAGKKVTHWGAHSVMIPKQSEHQEEAWLLAEFLSTVESAEIVFEGAGWIGPQKTFWDVVPVDRYQGLDFFVEHAAVEAELETVNAPSPAVAFAMSGFAQEVVDPVIFGDKDIQTALADFQTLVNEEEARIIRG